MRCECVKVLPTIFTKHESFRVKVGNRSDELAIHELDSMYWCQIKPSVVGYKVRFAPMVVFHRIRPGSGKSHCKKIGSLLARFCEDPFLADCRRNLSAPLGLAGDAIIIAIHLNVGAVFQKVFRFVARFHLATVGTTITRIHRLTRSLEIDAGRIQCVCIDVERMFPHYLNLARILAVLFVGFPSQRCQD
jgi:hypothetical protein